MLGRANRIRLFYLHTLRPEAQAKEPAIPNNTIVRGRCDSNARVVVRGIFDGVGVEARRAEFEHGRHGQVQLS